MTTAKGGGFLSYTKGSKWGRKILIDKGLNNHETFSLFEIKNDTNILEKRGDYQFINEDNELLKCCRSQGEGLCF